MTIGAGGPGRAADHVWPWRAVTALVSGAVFAAGCVGAPRSPRGPEAAGGQLDALPPGATIEARLGHTHVVTAVAVSPDGRRLVSGAVDHSVKIWDARSGRELLTLRGHRHQIASVEVSPDGRHVMSASYDQTVRIWDLESGRLVRRFDGHSRGRSGWVSGGSRRSVGFAGTFAVFVPGTHWAVSGAHDELVVWDTTTGDQVKRIVGHDRAVAALAVSRDGRWCVSADIDGTIKVWETATGREIRTFHSGSRHVRNLAVSSDGRWVVSTTGFDGPARVWDVATEGPGRPFGGPGEHASDVALSPDGQLIATASSRTVAVVLWDLATRREVRRAPLRQGGPTAIAFTADGRSLVVGHWDGTLSLVDVAGAHVLGTATENVARVSAMAFSPDGERLVVGGDGGELRLWRLRDLGLTAFRTGHQDRVASLAFSQDSRWIASGSSDGTVRVWDGATALEVRTFCTNHVVKAVAFSPDGRLVAAAGDQGVITVWEREDDRLVTLLWGPRTDIRNVVFSTDGRRLVSFGGTWWYEGRGRVYQGSVLALWDLATEGPVASAREDDPLHAALSPDGKLVVTDSGFGLLSVWNAGDLTVTRALSGHRSWVQGMTLSADGRWLLTGSQDRTLQLRDLATKDGRCVLSRDEGHGFVVAITGDGRLGASVGDGATVRLWNLVTGEEVARLVTYGDGAWVALTPDGYYHGSQGIDERLRLRVDGDTRELTAYRSALNRPGKVHAALDQALRPGVSDRVLRCAPEALP